MRILKRNLAFVMVLAMALGMMVTASAANVEDYKDANDITFVEAVDTLTALGILEGEDGTFNPQNTLTREQGAKIIAYLMLGKDAADNLKTSYAPFNDVAADRWSAGFVAYCVSQNIVGGYGNGNFGPNDTLTGTQFAKMLLCALGYGVNGEFTGTNWEIETNKQALTAGMFDGNLGANFTAGVKREEAALYAFNTLTDIMTVSYSDVFGDYYSGQMFKDIDEADEYKYTLGYTLYSLEKKDVADGDDFGRPCHTWKSGTKTLTDNYADEADAVYTKSVTSSKMYSDLGLTKETKTKAVIVDGAKARYNFVIDKNAEELDGDDLETGSAVDDGGLGVGRGVTVEAYVSEGTDGGEKVDEVTLVVVHTYLAQVTDYDAADNEVTVELKDTENAPTLSNNGDVFETAVEYEEDDYVFVTVADGEVKTLKPATTIEGQVDAASTNYIKFEGEQHDKAECNVNLKTSSVSNRDIDGEDIVYDSIYNLIVDDNGYAVALVLVEEGEDDTAGYIYVNQTQGRTENLLNGNAAVAEVTYLDGTGTETLPLETAKKTVDGQTVLCFKFIGGLSGATPSTTKNWYSVESLNDTDSDSASKQFAGFYRYSINSDGELVLKELDENYAYATKITASEGLKFDGETSKALNASKTIRLNSSTVMKVVDDDDKLTTLSGYKNIKITLDQNDSILVVSGSSGSTLAKDIYVMSNAAATSDQIFAFYMKRASDFETTNDGDMVRVYVDGEAQWYYTDEMDDYGDKDKGVYVIEVNSDNEVTFTDPESDPDQGENGDYLYTKDAVVTNRVTGGFTAEVDGEEKTFIYADDHSVYNVYDGISSTSNVAKNNVVTIIENEDGEVTLVFVTKKDVTDVPAPASVDPPAEDDTEVTE